MWEKYGNFLNLKMILCHERRMTHYDAYFASNDSTVVPKLRNLPLQTNKNRDNDNDKIYIN